MKARPMTSATLHREYPELKEFRQQIDTIDDEIARLLVARMEVVRQVGALKRSQGENKSFIRPDREAIMLRDLAAHFRETNFPASAATALWRIIIGTSTATESPLNISVAHGQERGSAVALAREYFGPTLPCRLHADAQAVLEDMTADPHCVGVLSADYPAGPHGSWWYQLATDARFSANRIFARIPFVLYRREADLEPVFLAGSVEPAPSGQDVSLFAVDADLTGRAPEGWTLLQISREQGAAFTLFEAHGWLTPGTPGYDALTQMLMETLENRPFRLYFLGAYAEPFSVES